MCVSIALDLCQWLPLRLPLFQIFLNPLPHHGCAAWVLPRAAGKCSSVSVVPGVQLNAKSHPRNGTSTTSRDRIQMWPLTPNPRTTSLHAQLRQQPKSLRQAKQWHQFIAAQKEFLQYSFVSLIASTTVLPSQIIDAPRCSEPHVNRQKKLVAVIVAHTLSHILLCFWLPLNRRTACIPVFRSKWWLSAASSIGQPLCELYGAKKVSAIASHRRSRNERPKNRETWLVVLKRGVRGKWLPPQQDPFKTNGNKLF